MAAQCAPLMTQVWFTDVSAEGTQWGRENRAACAKQRFTEGSKRLLGPSGLLLEVSNHVWCGLGLFIKCRTLPCPVSQFGAALPWQLEQVLGDQIEASLPVRRNREDSRNRHLACLFKANQKEKAADPPLIVLVLGPSKKSSFTVHAHGIAPRFQQAQQRMTTPCRAICSRHH